MRGPGVRHLSCGCPSCKAALERTFVRVMHNGFGPDEEANLELLAERLDIHYNADSIRERLAAYGLPRAGTEY